MRKAALVVAVSLAVATTVGIGRADPDWSLARCGGTAGVSGVGTAPNPSMRGVCQVTFTLAAPTLVAISLEPGTGFVGTLQATVTNAVEGHPVAGVFVNSVAVTGMSDLVVTLDTGTWKLDVTGGAAISCVTGNPPCPPPVGVGFGPFAASVSLASA